ncbi:MAG: hypothetical protein HYX69_00880 [Planctomycetia bacterium]|nr:hypothetical protein [Planctomycetia bacterium]
MQSYPSLPPVEKKSRRVQFSLASLLVLTAAVAIGGVALQRGRMPLLVDLLCGVGPLVLLMLVAMGVSFVPSVVAAILFGTCSLAILFSVSLLGRHAARFREAAMAFESLRGQPLNGRYAALAVLWLAFCLVLGLALGWALAAARDRG